MRIKHAEGQTLLTLVRTAIVFAACLSVGNVQYYADATFNFLANAETMVRGFLAEDQPELSRQYGQPLPLYYYEADGEHKNSGFYVYQQYYLTGSEGRLGLVNAAGQELLGQHYQGVVLLPHAYILKQEGQWRFCDRESLAPLNDLSWDDVTPDQNEYGLIDSNLVRVEKDGLFGAVDLLGQPMIEPLYDEFLIAAHSADWPLILVRQEGRCGFLDKRGRVVIDLIYDYAVLDTITLFADENDAQGVETTVVYVRQGEDWGGIFRQENGLPGPVDWSVEPSDEVLAAYQHQR